MHALAVFVRAEAPALTLVLLIKHQLRVLPVVNDAVDEGGMTCRHSVCRLPKTSNSDCAGYTP